MRKQHWKLHSKTVIKLMSAVIKLNFVVIKNPKPNWSLVLICPIKKSSFETFGWKNHLSVCTSRFIYVMMSLFRTWKKRLFYVSFNQRRLRVTQSCNSYVKRNMLPNSDPIFLPLPWFEIGFYSTVTDER